jgi:hypothetical protein
LLKRSARKSFYPPLSCHPIGNYRPVVPFFLLITAIDGSDDARTADDSRPVRARFSYRLPNIGFFVFFTPSVSKRYKLKCEIPNKNAIFHLETRPQARK